MLKFSSENLPPYHREYWEAQKDEQGYFVQLKKNRIEKVLPSDMRRFVIEWIG
ncbi:hypothetical protein ACILD6_10410 [Capnocytophaga canimorsus]|uniref:hypothetical protein n=1 Tax=Capnocytophaga canimorsus TaxID=28188 RepID=UPI0037CDF90B